MRLTLRTMLAYMDDILEPADRDEIARKIEESEFPRNLMQRIRESIRKSRLGAPKLNAKGMGLDPNTVAEYLDNTLSGERVPDFERVCLESDIHLAEVAACHQILTMVLGRPAEIDPALKRRLYGLAEQVPPAPPHDTPVTSAEDGAAISADEVRVTPARHRPEVPAYLRERPARSMWRTFVAAALLLVLLAGAITMALGPLDHRNPVARLLGIGQPQEEQVARNDKANGQAAKSEEQGKSDEAETSRDRDGGEEAGKETESDQPDVESTSPDETASDATAAPMADETPDPSAPESPEPGADASSSQSADPMLRQPPGAVPTLPPNTGVTSLPSESDPTPSPMLPTESAPEPDVLRHDPGAEPMPGDLAGGKKADDVDENAGASASEVPPEPMPPAGSMSLGRLVPSKGGVMLRFDAAADQWDLVPSGGALSAGDKLLVLPTYRPTITLSAGITLQVPSETLLELEPPDENGIPGVKLYYGRLVAMTTGQPGGQLRLDIGPVRGVVTFTDADSTLGAEERRFQPLGTDPEKNEPLVAVDLYAASGELQWTPDAGEPTTLAASQRLAVVPHPGEPPVDEDAQEIPPWIAGERLTNLEAGASLTLADALANDKHPVDLTLRQLAEHRRVENQSLAIRSLALIDQFEPLIAALKDFNYPRAQWPVLIATARNAIARGSETAAHFRATYENWRGASDGNQLFRRFWGYTRDQLADGAAAELVNDLDHDDFDFRLLAITNLQEVTGRHHQYRPEVPATARRQAVSRWRDDLRADRIVPKEPPAGRQ